MPRQSDYRRQAAYEHIEMAINELDNAEALEEEAGERRNDPYRGWLRAQVRQLKEQMRQIDKGPATDSPLRRDGGWRPGGPMPKKPAAMSKALAQAQRRAEAAERKLARAQSQVVMPGQMQELVRQARGAKKKNNPHPPRNADPGWKGVGKGKPGGNPHPKKAKKKASSKRAGSRVRMMAGYAYELDSPRRDWQKCSDEHWDSVMVSAAVAQVLGRRRIDGVQMVVMKHNGNIYAQTPASVTKL